MEKIKILYAAGNTSNSKIQLSRFLKAIADKPYTIKVAAYKNSSPSIHIDWTLDYLLNILPELTAQPASLTTYNPKSIVFESCIITVSL